MRNFFILLLSISLLIACSPSQKSEKISVVCTTGMIGDAVVHLLGDSVEVNVLMGPGVDPHLYKATQGDIEALNKANIIVYNGLHLEGKMTEIFEKLSRIKPTIAVGEQVNKSRLINNTDFAGAEDPHIWFDLELWSNAISGLAAQLKSHFPADSANISRRLYDYKTQLSNLHQYTLNKINEIPENQRVMITAHDAFKYFGRAYGLDVRGLQGISTAAEYGLQDVSELVKFIVERRINAIFVESSVPKKSIEAVIEGVRERGHEVKLGGELYSDAMGSEGSKEGTYFGMVKHNVDVISKALKGENH